MKYSLHTMALGAIIGAFSANLVTTAPVIAAEVKITLGHHYPKTHLQGKGYEAFTRTVNEKGKGKVHITSHPAASLINARESLKAVAKGSVHASQMLSVFQVGTMPMLNSISLPFLFEDREHFRRTLKAGLFEFFQKEYEKRGIKLLNYFSKGSIFIFHKKKFVITPVDFKNANLRALGGYMTLMLNEFGAKAVTLPTGEVTTALQRGVVDGLMTSCTAHLGRGWSEDAKYVSDLDLAESGEGLAFNLKFYNNLPADVKKIINDAAKELEEMEWDLVIKADRETCPKMWKERNLPNRKATSAERETLRKAAHALFAKANREIPSIKKVLALVEKTRHTK